VSTRKYSNLYPNEIEGRLRRVKRNKTISASSSTLSTKLSTEFYLEYFKILNSIQNPARLSETLNISAQK
jgi:hypothetical protein